MISVQPLRGFIQKRRALWSKKGTSGCESKPFCCGLAPRPLLHTPLSWPPVTYFCRKCLVRACPTKRLVATGLVTSQKLCWLPEPPANLLIHSHLCLVLQGLLHSLPNLGCPCTSDFRLGAVGPAPKFCKMLKLPN